MRDHDWENLQADALKDFFQQLRADTEMERSPGFYGRVLDRIAIERQSIWFPFLYSPVLARIAIACVILACSALLFVMHAEFPARSYEATIVALTSDDTQDQRDAVLSQFLAYPASARGSR